MAICPYFGQDKKFCDIGEEYISPYDVVAMSHFCSSRYRECDKFQELAQLHPEVLEHEVAPQVVRDDTISAPAHPHVQHKQIKIKFRNKWPLSQRLSSAITSSQAANTLSAATLREVKPESESPKPINLWAQIVLAGAVILVSGFGLMSACPVVPGKNLLASGGLEQMMLRYGIALTVVVAGLGMLLSIFSGRFVAAPNSTQDSAGAVSNGSDIMPFELLKTVRFYTLWLCFFIGSGTGMMVFGSVLEVTGAVPGDMALLVVVLSVGNAFGCLIAGAIAEKIGRATTLCLILVLQALLMFVAIPILDCDNGRSFLVVTLVTAMVFNSGTSLSLFPAFARASWGMRHFGINYGLLFSAWGAGVFILGRISELLKVKTGSVESSFIVAGVLLLVAAMLALSLRKQKDQVAKTAAKGVLIEDDDLLFQDARD